MKKWLALVLKLLTTGTVTLFLAACYGVMTVLDLNPRTSSLKITAVSPDGSGVKGLAVTLLDPPGALLQTTTTDGDGVALLSVPSSREGWKATIDDVDGQQNGGQFAETQVPLDDRDSYTVTLTRE